MVGQVKVHRGRVIPPEQGSIYPTMALGSVQEIRLLQTHVEGCMGRIALVLGQYLQAVGCARVELLGMELRTLSPVELEQWVWSSAVAPLDNRSSTMFQLGVHRTAAAAMTEAALGLKPNIRTDAMTEQPSETELRFLNRLGSVVTQEVIAENPALQGLEWLQYSSDAPEKKGLCLTMQLIFQEQSWQLTLYWSMAFAQLLDKLSGRSQAPAAFSRAQLEASLTQIPVQLKAVLLNTKLTMAELEQLMQGTILPITLQERVSLGCGGFTMGAGQLYDRQGHSVFQLHDASQQAS